jgi:hypothetical protein
LFMLLRSRIVLICTVAIFIVFIGFTQRVVNAGSTNLTINAYSGGGCSLTAGTSSFGTRIAYNSATDFNYVASIVSGPPGLSGTSSGTVLAGSSASYLVILNFNSIATPDPWSFVVQIDTFVAGNPQDRATATISCPVGAGPFTVTPISSIDISVLPSVPIAVAPVCITDSRINGLVDVDCAAPVVVFREGNGWHIYGINPDNAQGILIIALSEAQIAAIGIPDVNTLLDEAIIASTGQSVQVYRLSSGEYQLNTFYADGKPYIVVWDDEGNVRHLAN